MIMSEQFKINDLNMENGVCKIRKDVYIIYIIGLIYNTNIKCREWIELEKNRCVGELE